MLLFDIPVGSINRSLSLLDQSLLALPCAVCKSHAYRLARSQGVDVRYNDLSPQGNRKLFQHPKDALALHRLRSLQRDRVTEPLILKELIDCRHIKPPLAPIPEQGYLRK